MIHVPIDLFNFISFLIGQARVLCDLKQLTASFSSTSQIKIKIFAYYFMWRIRILIWQMNDLLHIYILEQFYFLLIKEILILPYKYSCGTGKIAQKSKCLPCKPKDPGSNPSTTCHAQNPVWWCTPIIPAIEEAETINLFKKYSCGFHTLNFFFFFF